MAYFVKKNEELGKLAYEAFKENELGIDIVGLIDFTHPLFIKCELLFLKVESEASESLRDWLI